MAHSDTLFPVVFNSADKEDNDEAATYIKNKVGRVDVIIANFVLGRSSALSESYRMGSTIVDEKSSYGPK